MPLWGTPDGMPPRLAVALQPGRRASHHIVTLRYGASQGEFTPSTCDRTSRSRSPSSASSRSSSTMCSALTTRGGSAPGSCRQRGRAQQRSAELEAG
jgi:hypothetical protein